VTLRGLPEMRSQLVLSMRERTTPGLNRGWRTPDPSPTRTSKGLPHCGSSWEVAEITDDARDGSSVSHGRAASPARAGAAHTAKGDPVAGLKLELRIDDLVDASTPRGHDQEAWGAPKRGAPSYSYADCSTSSAEAPSPRARSGVTPDAAWARIRTPSPEARALAPHAPPAWPQGIPKQPPQWGMPEKPAQWGGAQGTLEKPPQWMPFRSAGQPTAEPPSPPPPAPVATAAPRSRVPAREARAGISSQKCAPLDGAGPPKSPKAVLSVGSVGHPISCQEPCKYVRKNRGCKDGADCNRCHVCFWNRYEASRTMGSKR